MCKEWQPFLIPWTHRADHDSMGDSAIIQGEVRVWHYSGVEAMEKFNAQNPDKVAASWWTGPYVPPTERPPVSYRVSLVKSTPGYNYPPVGNYWVRLGDHTYRDLSREEWNQLFHDNWDRYKDDIEWDYDSPQSDKLYVEVIPWTEENSVIITC